MTLSPDSSADHDSSGHLNGREGDHARPAKVPGTQCSEDSTSNAQGVEGATSIDDSPFTATSLPTVEGRSVEEAILRDKIITGMYRELWGQLASFQNFQVQGDLFASTRERRAHRCDELGRMVIKLGQTIEDIVFSDPTTGSDDARGAWYQRLDSWGHAAQAAVREIAELHLQTVKDLPLIEKLSLGSLPGSEPVTPHPLSERQIEELCELIRTRAASLKSSVTALTATGGSLRSNIQATAEYLDLDLTAPDTVELYVEESTGIDLIAWTSTVFIEHVRWQEAVMRSLWLDEVVNELETDTYCADEPPSILGLESETSINLEISESGEMIWSARFPLSEAESLSLHVQSLECRSAQSIAPITGSRYFTTSHVITDRDSATLVFRITPMGDEPGSPRLVADKEGDQTMEQESGWRDSYQDDGVDVEAPDWGISVGIETYPENDRRCLIIVPREAVKTLDRVKVLGELIDSIEQFVANLDDVNWVLVTPSETHLPARGAFDPWCAGQFSVQFRTGDIPTNLYELPIRQRFYNHVSRLNEEFTLNTSDSIWNPYNFGNDGRCLLTLPAQLVLDTEESNKLFQLAQRAHLSGSISPGGFSNRDALDNFVTGLTGVFNTAESENESEEDPLNITFSTTGRCINAEIRSSDGIMLAMHRFSGGGRKVFGRCLDGKVIRNLSAKLIAGWETADPMALLSVPMLIEAAATQSVTLGADTALAILKEYGSSEGIDVARMKGQLPITISEIAMRG